MEIKIKKGEEIKVMTMAEYNEMMAVVNKYNEMVEKRRKAVKKHYESMTPEERKEKARKAAAKRWSKKNG